MVRPPGQEPWFHILVFDVVPCLDLAVGLANFGEEHLLIGDAGFDGI
jgi:hypothetical protein